MGSNGKTRAMKRHFQLIPKGLPISSSFFRTFPAPYRADSRDFP